eukprot:1109852-Rhodomonas_salina.1
MLSAVRKWSRRRRSERTCQMEERMKNISTKTAPNDSSPPPMAGIPYDRYHTCSTHAKTRRSAP